jgi:hypothetical protein
MARLSLVWTVAVGAVVALVPLSTTSVAGADASGTLYERTYHEALLDSEGPGLLVVLAVPALVAAIGALAPRRHAFAARLTAASLLFVGCALGIMSIGIFYVPALALMAFAVLQAANELP